MKKIWNKICRIFGIKSGAMSIFKKNDDYIKATSDGQLYVEKSDLFRDPKVIKTVEDFRNSAVYRDIIARKQSLNGHTSESNRDKHNKK